MIIPSVADEVLANLFGAVAEEMSHIVLRAAHSPFVRETQDYATALVTIEGEMFAYPHTTGVTSLMGLPMRPGIEAFADWRDGDVLITNDPYSTRGMVMHLPDLHLLKPVFHEGNLICFAWAFMHCSDVGGMVPGSIDIYANEIYQEGFRLRPMKLFEAGRRDENIWNFIADNSRIPDMNAGDLEALIAALNAVPKRIGQIIERFGASQVKASIGRIINNTEQRTKTVFRSIEPGSYNFVDYLEGDCISDTPVRIEVTLHSKGDGRIKLDFSGTDPQVQAALNLPTGGQLHHPFLSIAAVNYVVTRTEAIHLNAGILRCIELILPEGSIVNASFPAACGMRYLTAMRVHDAVLGALAIATRHNVPAAGAGEIAVTVLATPDSITGGLKVNVANPVQGGTGGGPMFDGIAGLDYPTAFLRNVPAEILESETPIRVHQFGLVPDSEGPGRLRGGHGIEFRFEMLQPGSRIVMRGKERYRFHPWGAAGGRAGSLGDTYVIRKDGSRANVGKLAVFLPAPGEQIVIRGAGGGGYGNPYLRPSRDVLSDVLNGLVSEARAKECYGVAICNGVLDEDETASLRKKLCGTPPPSTQHSFDLGVGRCAWERDYAVPARLLAQCLPNVPVQQRGSVKTALYSRVAGMEHPLDEPRIAAVLREVLAVNA